MHFFAFGQASAMAFTVYSLARHPEKTAKLLQVLMDPYMRCSICHDKFLYMHLPQGEAIRLCLPTLSAHCLKGNLFCAIWLRAACLALPRCMLSSCHFLTLCCMACAGG